MRTLVMGLSDYSLDGVIGEVGTPFFDFCRAVPDDPEHEAWAMASLRRADVHIFGRVTYEGMAGYFPTATGNPVADIMNRGRKVVFSRTLDHAEWANTTIARGDLIEEITKLRAEGAGEIIAHGGISFARSLVRHDLVDEYLLTVYPYLVGSGTTLFDITQPRALDLADSVSFANGVVGLTYRRRTGVETSFHRGGAAVSNGAGLDLQR
jgi:dihydrofolate reductase